jgi:hypothetical protein
MLPPKPVQSQPDQQAGETHSSLHRLLPELRLSELRAMVDQRGWAINGESKAELAATILPLLTDYTEVTRAVINLPDHLQRILPAVFVAEDGSGITPASLARVASALGIASRPHLKPVEAAGYLNDLARWGLLIPWRTASNELRYLFPSEIQRRIPPLSGWCPSTTEIREPDARLGQAACFVHLLLTVAERFARRSPRLRQLPQPPADRQLLSVLGDWPYVPEQTGSRVARVEPRSDRGPQSLSALPQPFLLDDVDCDAMAELTDGDQEKAEFVCRMLVQLNILAPRRGHLIVRRRELAAFRGSPAAQAQVTLAYLSLLDWSEFDWLLRKDLALGLWRNTYFSFSYNHFRSHLLLLRHTLLRFLATATAESWFSLSDVDRVLSSMWPTFFPAPPLDDQEWPARALGLAWQLVRRQKELVSPLEGQQGWQAAQGAFLRLILQGPLSWLGLADLYWTAGELQACRLHGLSDCVWGRGDQPPPSSDTEMITVDPRKRTITVDPRLAPPEVHPLLGSIARLEMATPVGFAYRLDMRRAYATFATVTLDQLLGAWITLMPMPVPELMLQQLGDWWARLGRVHLYDGLALIEVVDAVTLRELEAATSLPQRTLIKLSPRVLVVQDSAVEGLLQEFTTRGYTPKEVR